jgi:hypothetical protein
VKRKEGRTKRIKKKQKEAKESRGNVKKQKERR